MSIYQDASTWRLQTDGGIPYKLVEGYPKGSYEDENAGVTEQYIIRMSDLPAFALESFPAITGASGNFTWQGKRPLPGMTGLLTGRVDWEPFEEGLPADPWGRDPNAPSGSYAQFARVTIDYGPSKQAGQDPNNPITFLEISADFAGEVKQISTTKLEFDRSPNAPGEVVAEHIQDISKFCPLTEWTVRWPSVKDEYMWYIINASRELIGKVNSVAMPLFGGATTPAEVGSILYLGFSFHEQVSWRSTWGGLETHFETTMKFLEKTIIWHPGGPLRPAVKYHHNHEWNPEGGENGNGGWEELKDDDGNPIYPLGNLNALFAVL